MKVLSAFLFLSSALAQRNDNSAKDATMTSMASVENMSAPAEIASISGTTNSGVEAGAGAGVAAGAVPVDGQEPGQPGSAAPLFDFDLAPYNVALDIVAEALEKLADTMEPLNVPLPLVGPGYYLEVQVKSPKNPHAQPPTGQINPVSIEGGQAPPVTEIDIILPGDSAVHQTIILPANGQGVPIAEQPTGEAVSSESISAPVSIPHQEPEEISDDYVASLIGATMEGSSLSSASSASVDSAPSGASDSTLVPPIPAGTESAAGPLFTDDEASSTVVSPVSGTQLAQSISPEPLEPMETVGGFESFGELSDGFDEVEFSESAAKSDEEIDALAPVESNVESESPMEAQSESELAQVTDSVHGVSAFLEEQSLSTSVLAVSESIASTMSSSADPWANVFPSAASSAPSALDVESASDETEEPQLELDSESESEAESEPESEPEAEAESESEAESEAESESGSEAGSEDQTESESVDDDVTMVSELLPFPPFGGPQTQQPTMGGLDDASSTQPSESASASAAAATDAPIVESDNVIQTINIVDASDENALESSIDAVLHSVIQDYKTESIPKAAVGFALIHPRSAVIPDSL